MIIAIAGDRTDQNQLADHLETDPVALLGRARGDRELLDEALVKTIPEDHLLTNRLEAAAGPMDADDLAQATVDIQETKRQQGIQEKRILFTIQQGEMSL